MPVRAGTIDADHLPEPGSIYSLTVRRGAEDPRTLVRATVPLCYRLVVLDATPSEVTLRAPDGQTFAVSVEQFNARIAPHIVAAYGPAPGDKP